MKKTNTFKRFAAITSASILAACMVAPMAMSSNAEGETPTYKINIDSTVAGHEYEVYQIFAGDLSSTGVLSNIEWGTGINSAELGDAEAKANSLTSDDLAAAFAKEIADKLTTPAGSDDFDDDKYEIDGLAPGYYLIKDKDGSQNGENATYTSYILKVVKNITVTPKSGMVDSQKKVIDTNDSIADSTTGLQDSADYDIGDLVPFQLKGTVAEDYDSYTVYQFVFHDKECEGLTFDSSTVEVKVDGVTITEGYEIVESPTDGCTFEIKFANLKTISSVKKGSVITVDYKSLLNESADIGLPGNPNTSYLTFSNNPNDETGNETGKTVEDTVIVFTYQTVIDKVDGEGNPLTGAQFKLEKYDVKTDTWVVKAGTVDAEGDTFTFTGLDDGKYKLTETVTPDGFNTIDPIEFEITAEHDVLSDNPTLNELLGGDLVTGDFKATGIINTEIENNAGNTLPETGGIGTTLFYLGGGAMVAVAGVYLISKKRMKNAE